MVKRPHEWRLVSSGIGGFRAKKRHTKASQYFVALDLIPNNARQECVATALPICLFTDTGLRSSLSRSDREVRAGTNLCWWYACLSYKRRVGNIISVKTLSGYCRIRQTCFACAHRKKWMRKRNGTVKIIHSNFKRLRTEWGGLGRPSQLYYGYLLDNLLQIRGSCNFHLFTNSINCGSHFIMSQCWNDCSILGRMRLLCTL